MMNLTVLYYRDHATEFLEALGQYREALKVTNYFFFLLLLTRIFIYFFNIIKYEKSLHVVLKTDIGSLSQEDSIAKTD